MTMTEIETETDLQEYFKELKRQYNLPDDIKLNWIPDNRCKYHGMASKDLKSIFIFDEDVEEAKSTLVHECLEILLTSTLMILSDSKIPKEDRYLVKEGVIERLVKDGESIDNKTLAELFAVYAGYIDGELKNDTD